MTDIDEDHKLLPNEASVKSDAKIHQPVPLARFDSDAGFDERLHSHDVLDSPAVHQTDGGEFGMSLSYTNPKLVDDVRQQLKLMRETSTDQSSLKSPLS
jgi:hypothetical protein